MTPRKHKGIEFSNVSEEREHHEKNKTRASAPGKEKENTEKETLGNDYWDRIAEDAASGYKNEETEDSILNVDQEPGDNERGDKDAE